MDKAIAILKWLGNYDAEEALVELKELMQVKSCDGCKHYTGGDWNTVPYSSQYNNDVSYFDRIGVGVWKH